MPTFVSVKHERRDGLSESRAAQGAMEGFESPSVVGGEGPRLGALWRRVLGAVSSGSWMHNIFLNSVVTSFNIHVLVSSRTCTLA
jgi:hypothetical protein